MTELNKNNFANLKGYNGNANLKRSNQSIEWTPNLVEEYVKCQNDVVYFTETYMKIINIDKGLVNFKLYPYQKEMLTAFANNRFNIVTTARQAGKCQKLNTPIKVRNKKTGEIIETTIGEFHERVKKDKSFY